MIREFAPDVLITHTDTDPFNPDHPVAYAAVDRARSLAAGAGRAERVRRRSSRRSCSCSSRTSPSCATSRRPSHVDITSVWDQKVAAMAEMKAQQYLQTYYAQRGEQRGNHARRASGDQRGPLRRVVHARAAAGRGGAVNAELARLGAATVYEASGRQGLVDAELRQLIPGSRACGPARIARCGQDDNLMVHAAMARAAARRGARADDARAARRSRCSATCCSRRPIARGAAAVLVDAAVRDVEELAEMAVPVWARWVRSRGATKDIVGELDVPVVVGGARDPPGRPRRARRRRRHGRGRRARRRGARGLARARGEGGASSARSSRPARCPGTSTASDARV